MRQLLVTILSWLLKVMGVERTPSPKESGVLFISTSREDQRRYRRWCKRKGMNTMYTLPDKITVHAHRALKAKGIIK